MDLSAFYEGKQYFTGSGGGGCPTISSGGWKTSTHHSQNFHNTPEY